ncbi:MAG: nucleotidyltransferase family protein [Tepidisphaeraceae bacterium]
MSNANAGGLPARYEDIYRQGGHAALVEAQRFLMGESAVQESLVRIAKKLDELGIPYAICGGMSLVAHGYNRTTIDVDILVSAESLKRIHKSLDGLGYVPPFAGSKHLRDTATNVRIEFLVSGGYPGDGKPKPVQFPLPEAASVEINGIRYLSLPRLIELKLASGMTAPGRLKDFADIQELVKVLQLSDEIAVELSEYVRPTFLKLAKEARESDAQE